MVLGTFFVAQVGAINGDSGQDLEDAIDEDPTASAGFERIEGFDLVALFEADEVGDEVGVHVYIVHEVPSVKLLLFFAWYRCEVSELIFALIRETPSETVALCGLVLTISRRSATSLPRSMFLRCKYSFQSSSWSAMGTQRV